MKKKSKALLITGVLAVAGAVAVKYQKNKQKEVKPEFNLKKNEFVKCAIDELNTMKEELTWYMGIEDDIMRCIGKENFISSPREYLKVLEELRKRKLSHILPVLTCIDESMRGYQSKITELRQFVKELKDDVLNDFIYHDTDSMKAKYEKISSTEKEVRDMLTKIKEDYPELKEQQ